MSDELDKLDFELRKSKAKPKPIKKPRGNAMDDDIASFVDELLPKEKRKQIKISSLPLMAVGGGVVTLFLGVFVFANMFGNGRADKTDRDTLDVSVENKANQKTHVAKPVITEVALLPKKIGKLTVEITDPTFKTVKQTVITQEASTELVVVPAQFDTVIETVVVIPESTKFVVEPAVYEWVKGDVEGNAVEYTVTPAVYESEKVTVVVRDGFKELVAIPASFETVVEPIVTRPEYTAKDSSLVPAITKDVSRRILKTPARIVDRSQPAVNKVETRRVIKTAASVVERVVPYEKKKGKTQVVVQPASVTEKRVFPVTKQVNRRVIRTPARVSQRVMPAVSETFERQVLVGPYIYLRDADGKIVREFESREAFKAFLTTVK